MSIAGQVKICLDSFRRICDELKVAANESDRVLGEELNEELGRFRVWAGNIAAHKSGLSSLEYRLRDATHLQEKVLAYLKDMVDILKSCRSEFLSTNSFTN